MKRKRKPGLLPALLAVAIVAAAAVFYAVFYVPDENIEVVGNTRYTESEIRQMAMPGFIHRNAMYLKLFRKTVIPEQVPFITSVDIEYVARDRVRLHVNEDYPIGYVLQDGCRYYFDADGLVTERLEDAPEAEESDTGSEAETPDNEAETPESGDALQPEPVAAADTAFHPAVTDVALVKGLTSERVSVGEVIQTGDPEIFQILLTLNRLISKFEIRPDSIQVGEGLNISLFYGEAEIRLGKDELMEQKMTRAAAILPQIRDLHGVLHLENYSEDTINIIFEQLN